MTQPAERHDRVIDADLAALRELAESHARLEGGYRDAEVGATMQRDALAAQRRRELWRVVPAVQIAAARVGRTAAGAAALVAAALMLRGLPMLARRAVPHAGRVVILAALAVAAVYLVVRGLAARRIGARLRRAVATTSDPHADLDTLAVGPLELARQLAGRVDRWAITFAIAGGCAVASITGFMALTLGSVAAGWAPSAQLLGPRFGEGLREVAIAMLVATALAAWLGRACVRPRTPATVELLARRTTPGVIGLLARRATLELGFAGAALMAAGSLALIRTLAVAQLPPAARLAVALGGELCLVTVAAWLALRVRRSETEQLERA